MNEGGMSMDADGYKQKVVALGEAALQAYLKGQYADPDVEQYVISTGKRDDPLLVIMDRGKNIRFRIAGALQERLAGMSLGGRQAAAWYLRELGYEGVMRRFFSEREDEHIIVAALAAWLTERNLIAIDDVESLRVQAVRKRGSRLEIEGGRE
jgi:hypothetical protein